MQPAQQQLVQYERVEYYNSATLIVQHQIVQYWNGATSNKATLDSVTSQSATSV